MADGTPPAHRIRSAADEAAESTNASAPHIQSASDETAGKPRHSPAGQRSQQSDTGTERAARDFAKRVTGWTAQPRNPSADPTPNAGGRNPGDGREAGGNNLGMGNNLAMAQQVGGAMTSAYGAVYAEMIQQMQRASMRQTEMLSDLSQIRGPGDAFAIGQRYLMQGMMDMLGSNMRMAQASFDAVRTAGRATGQRDT